MKKFLLLLLIFMPIIVTAQIQRNVYGFLIGESTFTDIESRLNANSWKMSPNTIFAETYNVVPTPEKISFGGLTWDSMTISFHKNTFYLIKFLSAGLTNETKFQQLSAILSRKYAQYRRKYNSRNIAIFSDSNTTVELELDDSGLLSLTYKDKRIERLNKNSNSDEL